MRFVFKMMAVSVSMIQAITPVFAAETVTYTYDALGRLIAVNHVGDVNNGQSNAYVYDPAGNRTSNSVTGVKASFIIVPLGELIPIFIK